jgi:hypothetical protein
MKSVAKRAWGKVRPGIVTASKKALPHAIGILKSKGNKAHKKKAARGLAKSFGMNVIRSLGR